MNKVPKILKRPIYFTIMTISLLCLFVLLTKSNILSKLLSFSDFLDTGYTEEIKSIELNSPGYDTGSSGSFNITKSAEWTGKHEVTIKFNIKTLEIPRNTNRHIILVMDTSESMNEGRMDSLHKAVTALSENLFTNTNNQLSLITFDTSAEIKTGFTRDTTLIESIMTNLEAKGATNYYLALKEVDTLLSTYTQPDNTDTHLIFITDGYPTAGGGMYELQYKKLIEKYPYLMASAIQLEMGTNIVQPVEKISQYQYYAYMNSQSTTDNNDELSSVLLDAARASEYYSSIELTDYVNNEYFTIKSSSVDTTHGKTTITSTDSEQKIIWNIEEDEVKSGTIIDVELSFKIQLKEEYYNIEAYLPTNSSTTLKATAPQISDISFTSTNTPVLQSWYEVVYNSNVPLGCSTTYELTEKYYPYDTVTITNQILSCPNSQFKGWEVADNSVTIISDESFIMPGHNTEIGAKWTELSINKSMIGTINSRTTLYEVVTQGAVPDNEASEYVTSTSGISIYSPSSDTNGKGLYIRKDTIDNEKPIYYFRGNVGNNNVIFGGFCWKIIRTTDTGGIKLIYNGTPVDGQCTATGTDTTIGTSAFNEFAVGSYGSLANAGYMFGERYGNYAITLGEDEWMYLVGKQVYVMSWYGSSYMFGTTATWDGSKYVLGNATSYSSSSDVSEIAGKYLCYVSGGTATSCLYTYYMFLNSDGNLRMFKLENGETYDALYNEAFSTTWIYGNDVTYDESTGMYSLQNTIELKPVEYGNNIDTVNGDTKYHYTCMSSSTTCSEVYYFYSDVESYMLASYIKLTGGKTIENAINEMIEEPSDTTSSTAKIAIDTWYENNMTNYTYMLEDTIFCNERTAVDADGNTRYNGWDKNGDSRNSLHFTNESGYKVDSCSINNSFTTTSLGNGKLTYPVGLLTANEARYAGGSASNNSSYYLYNGLNNWLLTPSHHNNLKVYMTTINNNGWILTGAAENTSYYLRPVISLKPGVFASDGDGTTLNPYIIEME